MHPSSLLSYYPTYAILDEIISINDYKNLQIYMDLKNNLQTTFMEHAIINILESSERSRFIDTSIFESVMAFISFHKLFSIKREINIDFIIFLETGHSYYHLNISPKYKVSRQIDDLYGLDREKRDKFYQILQSNFMLIEKAFHKMPQIRVVRLPNLEADFVPYYYLTRGFADLSGETAHIVYSNDHDLMQCLGEHRYIFSKSAKSKKIIKAGKVIETLLKRETSISDEYLPLVMAVIGDPGDDVVGVKGIGGKRFLDMFEELISISGNMEEIYDKINRKEPIFPYNIKSKNKYLTSVIQSELQNQQITKNLKLVSFELISRAVDNPPNTELLEKQKCLVSCIEKDQITPLKIMKEALEKNRVYLGDDFLEVIYYGHT